MKPENKVEESMSQKSHESVKSEMKPEHKVERSKHHEKVKGDNHSKDMEMHENHYKIVMDGDISGYSSSIMIHVDSEKEWNGLQQSEKPIVVDFYRESSSQ